MGAFTMITDAELRAPRVVVVGLVAQEAGDVLDFGYQLVVGHFVDVLVHGVQLLCCFVMST